MTSRREFLASSAVAFVGCSLPGHAQAQPRRRETVVAGKRVKVVDVHAHCVVPEAMALLDLKLGGPTFRPDMDLATTAAGRIAAMDAQGIDMEALSINPFWYQAEREVAGQLIRIQNEKLAAECAAHADRFVAFASVALQYPELAAQQLETAVKSLGLRGAAIGGSVNGIELSDPKFHPFWAKAQELGVLVFIHPQPAGAPGELSARLKGNGYLGNVIGNPLETAIALSHLIFEGTLDKFPGLKICAAHGGGYLPSYSSRSDIGCLTRPDQCPGGVHGAIRKPPSEYLRQLYYDTMVFTAEDLRHLAAVVGAGQLMIGTDFPYPWTTTAVDAVMNLPQFSDAEREAVLGGTAARLLGLTS
jgi:aminocarboxymuconate-semialdehyde decarboxylase